MILFSLAPFRWAGMEEPTYPESWQCLGMVVGVYGAGYLIAATNPLRHWPIVFVGLLGKILGPIGFLNAALSGTLPRGRGSGEHHQRPYLVGVVFADSVADVSNAECGVRGPLGDERWPPEH
ncbi:MAG: hypothetical protein HYX51_08915 [Chloroflexi bacterium]|nr:hypothetical protein [Chloroflexota bacterium]